MSRNLDDLLEYEARRHPELANVIANLGNMTEADIKAVRLPLPWIRKTLLARKRNQERDLLAGSLDQWVIDGHTPDPMGEMRRWEASNTFIRVGRSQLEIQYGHLIWLEANTVWIDSIRSQVIDPLLLRHTISCGHVRRSAYLEAVRVRSRQLMPHEMAPTPMERVRFYRPG
jgi:hypothetical protein